MTSTSTLQARVRNLYHNCGKPEQMDTESRKRLGDYRTQLLCRGYVTSVGKRGGVNFMYVGYVPEDAPAWNEVER